MVAVLVLILTCNAPNSSEEATNAAEEFTRAHANLRASVAGSDCRVLLISTKSTFNDDLVESIHYATDGGEQVAQDYGFRAVIYRDAKDNVWTYGATTQDEARSMPRCR